MTAPDRFDIEVRPGEGTSIIGIGAEARHIRWVRLGPGANVDRFVRYALEADDKLFAALLLQDIARIAAAAGQPWVDPSLDMINDAGLNAVKIRAYANVVTERKDGAAAAALAKRTKAAAILERLSPYFRKAAQQYGGLPGEAILRRLAKVQIKAELKDDMSAADALCKQVTRRQADAWLAKEKAARSADK